MYCLSAEINCVGTWIPETSFLGNSWQTAFLEFSLSGQTERPLTGRQRDQSVWSQSQWQTENLFSQWSLSGRHLKWLFKEPFNKSTVVCRGWMIHKSMRHTRNQYNDSIIMSYMFNHYKVCFEHRFQLLDQHSVVRHTAEYSSTYTGILTVLLIPTLFLTLLV